MSENHIIQAGECLGSVAFRAGFHWETLWNLAENAELKSKRKEHNLLVPGDLVFIPDKRIKEMSRSPEARHTFKVKGIPAKLRIRVYREKEDKSQERNPTQPAEQDQVTISETAEEATQQEPAGNIDYLLEIDGKSTRGKTNGEGMVIAPIPPDAQEGRLILEPGTRNERTIELRLGHLDPVEEASGQGQRLQNLGFLGAEGMLEGHESELADAIGAFQRAQGMNPSGEMDSATRDKLKDVHGS